MFDFLLPIQRPSTIKLHHQFTQIDFAFQLGNRVTQCWILEKRKCYNELLFIINWHDMINRIYTTTKMKNRIDYLLWKWLKWWWKWLWFPLSIVIWTNWPMNLIFNWNSSKGENWCKTDVRTDGQSGKGRQWFYMLVFQAQKIIAFADQIRRSIVSWLKCCFFSSSSSEIYLKLLISFQIQCVMN